MLITAFFRWWYHDGWISQVQKFINFLHTVGQLFSVKLLLRTLFSPWRRVISAPGRGLESHIQAAVDNLIGRLVGFFVRIMVLFAAGITGIFAAVLGSVYLLSWPLLPFVPLICVIMGVFA